MHVAITGGTGFLGKPLVERLVALGHQVRVLSRNPDKALLPAGVTGHRFDGVTPPEPAALAGVQRLFHLAGEPIAARFTEAHKRRVRESRVEGTRAIVAAARAAGTVQVLVSASAIGFYGDRGDEPLTEEAAPGNDFLASVVTQWEAASRQGVDGAFRVVNPRIGVVLHPEGGALAQMLPAFRLGAGPVMGSGRQWMSWVHRDDVVSLLLLLGLQTGPGEPHAGLEGPVNVTAPEPVTQRQFARSLGRALHRPVLVRAPAFALKLAMGEMANLVLEGQRVLPVRAQQAGFQFAFPRLDDALAALLGD